MPLIFSKACYPAPFGVLMALKETTGCCEVEFEFVDDWEIKILPYTPNAGPEGPLGSDSATTWLPAPIDYEVYSGGIEVDDDLAFAVGRDPTRADIFEAGQHLRNLTADPGQGFPGGMSVCNGAHEIERETFIISVPAKEKLEIALFDNHGIEVYARGSVIVRPVSPP
jgi:hypothetical protein